MLLINLPTYDQYQQYSSQTNLYAIAALGVIFFLLGWIISRLLRPSDRASQNELRSIKKELLDELNTAKKFNADYHLLAKKDDQDNKDDK